MTTPTTSTTTDPAAAAVARDDRMPPGIPFIVANEFAERFCYYGINCILTIYMTQNLRMGDAEATTFHSLFKSGAYFFPVVGAIVSDVFWGKFRTIMTFSLAYVLGCTLLALVPGKAGLMMGLFFVAFGTGGIKPCVSTNVGDQFTSKNQHLIERAFNYFYFAINAGSSISIFLCPILLGKYGPTWGPRLAFGMPAAMMFFAALVFWFGRNRYAVVPPSGWPWLREELGRDTVKTAVGAVVGALFLALNSYLLFGPLGAFVGACIGAVVGGLAGALNLGKLTIIYFFIAFFWSLWDQSNGQTWTLQAQSSLMDKDLGPLFRPLLSAINGVPEILPAQIQVVNGFFILVMVPIFTFAIYPLIARFTKVTPLRRIGMGLFVVASSFLIVSWIEAQIQAGNKVSAWWQILAYVVLTASEILVSITGLEFSYKQAPLKIKSFVMSLFLLSVSFGNVITAGVNLLMVKPLQATAGQPGAETWITLTDVAGIVSGQKLDFDDTGLMVSPRPAPDGKAREPQKLAGTLLVAAVDDAGHRVRLMDVVDRQPIVTTGTFDAAKAKVSTYRLVGPQYFNFFSALMAAMGVLFVLVAYFYPETTHVREEETK